MAERREEVSGEHTPPHESTQEFQDDDSGGESPTGMSYSGIAPKMGYVLWENNRQASTYESITVPAAASYNEIVVTNIRGCYQEEISALSPQAASNKETVVTNVLGCYQEKVSALLPADATRRPITIFQLPSYIRQTNEDMYKPKLVSIGPYHANKHLDTLQEHKWWCARDFMNAHNMDPEECIRKIAADETRARLCYSEEIELSSNMFVKMLLLDGCFILDYIRKHHDGVLDTFFNIERNKATIMTDILLVENQIPYFVIHELFNLATGNSSCSESSSCQLRDQIYKLLPRQVSWKEPTIQCSEIHHLLHFNYLCAVPDPSTDSALQSPSHKMAKAREPIPYKPKEHRQLVMPSATELAEAGVSFRGNNKPRDLFHILFINGVMEIPVLFLHDLNSILLANLLAFEQCSYGPKGIMSQFASLNDNLIDTEKDVSLLESSGVLINMMGSEEETASFFNRLSKWNLVDHTDDHKELIRNIRKFCDSPWLKYRAILVRDYFNNPWAIISFIAALVLLGLTVVQTYYTIYSSIHN